MSQLSASPFLAGLVGFDGADAAVAFVLEQASQSQMPSGDEAWVLDWWHCEAVALCILPNVTCWFLTHVRFVVQLGWVLESAPLLRVHCIDVRFLLVFDAMFVIG